MSFHPMTAGQSPFDADRPGRERMREVLPALILIALGLAFFVGNAFDIRGATIFFGLGLAFLIGRIASDRYGLAVPAGILLAFGAFVALEESRLLRRGPFVPEHEGAWFFLLLALGFVAVYVIGARPSAAWPLVPAAVLGTIGLLMFGWATLLPIASLSWVTAYWPLVLIAVGAWLLARDALPTPVRTLVGTAGLIALLLYGVLAVAASVATSRPVGVDGAFRSSFGSLSAPIVETVTLSSPVGVAETLQVRNAAGRTTIRPTDGGEVRVVATKHLAAGQQLDVGLSQASGGLVLDARSPTSTSLGSAWVDYEVQLPAAVATNVQSSSGTIDIAGMSGAVEANASSGSVRASGLSGPTTIRASSGSITLSDITGDLRASTSSGSIRATNVSRVLEATSTSGIISLDGQFTEAARVKASSGEVQVRFAPGSSTMVDVRTSSGSIRTPGLSLADLRSDRRSLSGRVGAGGNALTIETTSGGVSLSSGG